MRPFHAPVVRFLLINALTIGLGLLAMWALGMFDFEMSPRGWLALWVGLVLTAAISVGLMAAMFYGREGPPPD